MEGGKGGRNWKEGGEEGIGRRKKGGGREGEGEKGESIGLLES